MTTSQIIACAISVTAAIVSITALVLVRRARHQPIRWETNDHVITFPRRMSDAEVKEFRARWLEAYADTACPAYAPSATPADSGLCARCGMYDYKHQEATGA